MEYSENDLLAFSKERKKCYIMPNLLFNNDLVWR